MVRRLVAPAALAAALAVASCSTINLTQAVEVTDIISGWYDNGIKDGFNHMVPMITFRLKNKTDQPLNSVQLTVAFWQDGSDGEADSRQVVGIGGTAVPAGQSSDSITVRSSVGYTLEGPRADLFTHSLYKDWTVKMFARRSGRIYSIGEFKIDRRFIPQAVKDAGRP
jgi:hypothetical protein